VRIGRRALGVGKAVDLDRLSPVGTKLHWRAFPTPKPSNDRGDNEAGLRRRATVHLVPGPEADKSAYAWLSARDRTAQVGAVFGSNPCSRVPSVRAIPSAEGVCAEPLPGHDDTLWPGFERGTKPTRITGEILGRCKKCLQIAGFRCELTSPQIRGYCARFTWFRQRDRVAAQRPHRRQPPAGRLPPIVPTGAALATTQALNGRVTTLRPRARGCSAAR
jgi:hypothetical protein